MAIKERKRRLKSCRNPWDGKTGEQKDREREREREDSIRDDERAFLLCGHSVFPYHLNTDMI